MKNTTYSCSICGRSKTLPSDNRKKSIKSVCHYCGKKNKFNLQAEAVEIRPISNFCSTYTLANSLTIACDHVKVEGINIKGDVHVKNSRGTSFTGTKISNNKELDMAGNININNSNIGTLKSNIASGDLNVTNSNIQTIDKNLLGFQFDNDETVIEIINTMILGDMPSDFETKLHQLQQILQDNQKIAEKLGARLNKENNRKNGALGSVILQSLKSLGLSSLAKAQDKGLDTLFNWFMVVIDQLPK